MKAAACNGVSCGCEYLSTVDFCYAIEIEKADHRSTKISSFGVAAVIAREKTLLPGQNLSITCLIRQVGRKPLGSKSFIMRK